jgi:hypothetical protein
MPPLSHEHERRYASNVRFGSIASDQAGSSLPDVRFTSNSDKLVRRNEVTLCAITGREQMQQGSPYSITISSTATFVSCPFDRQRLW